MLKPLFAQRTTADWMEILEAHSVPAGPIYEVNEVFEDPQVVHSGIVQVVNHHARGEVRLVGQPVTLSRTPARLASASPDAGEHSDEVLTEFGFTQDEISALREKGAV
jgi:crotonobetainyl-CoA:carnitine CoA-transferase CaiB-like acyl-CoA transferase